MTLFITLNYKNETTINQILTTAKLFEKFGTIDLDAHTFPIEPGQVIGYVGDTDLSLTCYFLFFLATPSFTISFKCNIKNPILTFNKLASLL